MTKTDDAMGEGLRNLGPVLPQADGVTTGGIAPWQRRSVARKREVVATALLRNWLLDIFMKMLQSLLINL
jgi:hypothetical protein